jgi:hypothetical protein
MRYHLAASMAVAVVLSLAAARSLAVDASPDITQPITTTSYFVNGTPSSASTSITENVASDPASGPWHKNLINNTGNSIASGNNVGVQEILTNTGTPAWTGWNERVVTRTTINTPNDSPGFLFRQGSLSLQGDYGSGFVPLTQGPDYTLTPVPYTGPPDPTGNDQGWEAVTISLAPARQILNGQRLQINEQVFEVFLDGNLWAPSEAAELAQYPIAVPEPAGLAVIALAATGMLARRRRVKQPR